VNGVRIDKWLWAARFFKTRALASKACELGRVLSNSVIAKAAREVRIGDTLQVRNEAGDFVLEVLTLSEVRRPAAVAQTLYRETEESKQARAKAADERKAMFASGAAPARRPTKRDRRLIHKFSGE
jgi:ribosome-associated heat shock protein Hsp15